MSSINKFELNKLIVSMRHNVKRAKVQTVSKLTRQIKTLKSKKATETLKNKNEKKAERLVNEILVMKKIPSDEVAAFSLMNTKDVTEILSDVESSFRLKALARLSIHKSISPVVKQFRAKYPSWEIEFPKVLVALKKREKLKSDKDKSKKKKAEQTTESAKSESSNSDSNDGEDGKENDLSGSDNEMAKSEKDSFESDYVISQNEGDFSEPESEISDSRNDDTLNIDDSIVCTRGNRFSISSDDFNLSDISLNQSMTNKNINKKKNNEKKSRNERFIEKVSTVKSKNQQLNIFSEKPILSEKLIKKSKNKQEAMLTEKPNLTEMFTKKSGKKQEAKTTENPNLSEIHTKKSEKNQEAQLISSDILSKIPRKNQEALLTEKPITSETFTTNNGVKRKHDNSPFKQVVKQKVDPFFLSSDNKPYKTIDQVFKNNDRELEYDDEETSSFNTNNSNNFQPNKRAQFNNFNNKKQLNESSNFNNKNTKKFDKIERPLKNKKFNDKTKLLTEKTDEKLHPSWAAKKKISTIANFEGKKVVFD